MTQDEIIRSPLGREQLVALAREAGLYSGNPRTPGTGNMIIRRLEHFATLVAAYEHEKILKIVLDDTYAMTFQTFGQYRTAIAKFIRESK